MGSCLKSAVSRTIMRLLFSHVGLCVLVVGYAVAGAYLFIAIEMPTQDYETEIISNYSMDIDTYREDIIESTVAYCLSNASLDYLTARKWLDDQLQAYHNAVSFLRNDTLKFKYQQYEGVAPTPFYLWDIGSALLFTASILTTIGYGHVTPVTETGFLVCVFYSVFAVPLMSMFLVNITGVFNSFIRFSYHRGCCFLMHNRRRREHDREFGSPEVLPPNGTVVGRPKSAWDGATPTEKEMEHLHAHDPSHPNHPSRYHHHSYRYQQEHHYHAGMYGGENHEANKRNQDVPAALSMVIIVAYLIMGATLFHFWEGWTMIQAVYFSTVTLMTIGFGDYVPGVYSSDAGTSQAQARTIVAAAYIVVGMAVFAANVELIIQAMRHRYHHAKRHLIRGPQPDNLYQHQHDYEPPAIKPYTT